MYKKYGKRWCRMKGEKRFLSRIAALLALLLALSAVSACGKDENSSEDEDAAARLQQILSDPWYYTDDVPVEFDQPVSDLIKKDGGFEYEKAKAQKVFGGDKVKVSKSKRNAFVKEYGTGVFDESAGTGVFLINDPEFSGAGHHGFYLEYTSDKGAEWNICDGAYYTDAYVKDIRLSGNQVYLFMVSEPSNKSYILYSDDLCRTFRIRDVITLLPDYAELMYFHTGDMEILDFRAEDGSVTIGWYDYEYIEHTGGDAMNYFLTAKFNGDLTEGVVVSADDDYIKKSAEKSDNFEEDE